MTKTNTADLVLVPRAAVEAMLNVSPSLCEMAGLKIIEQPQFPSDMYGKPVTAHASMFNLDMSVAPLGGKLIVLNPSNVAVFAVLSIRSLQYFRGWAPLPKIPKETP